MRDGGEEPKLRLVSKRSQRELDEAQRRRDEGEALSALSFPLRALAANLIRVTRGAGKPSEIGAQAARLVVAFESYRNRLGCFPASHDLTDLLSIRDQSRGGERSGDEPEMGRAKEAMVRGALQIVASRLLQQNTQEQAGESEMEDGMRRFDTAIEQRRARDVASVGRQARPGAPGRKPGKPK